MGKNVYKDSTVALFTSKKIPAGNAAGIVY